MEHLIVREVSTGPGLERYQAVEWVKSTLDGDLIDLDVFEHRSTQLLAANLSGSGTIAYLPVQQPLMLENLIFRPGLSDGDRARAMTRMTEAAISEAYRRDAGELYFLCREPSTCAFAERHKFERIDGPDSRLKMKVYRLNLRETFGA